MKWLAMIIVCCASAGLAEPLHASADCNQGSKQLAAAGSTATLGSSLHRGLRSMLASALEAMGDTGGGSSTPATPASADAGAKANREHAAQAPLPPVAGRTSGGGDDNGADKYSSPKRHGLGWQSLLPGSIQ